MPTALEIAQGRSAPLSGLLYSTVQTAHPLFSAFDARTSVDDRFLSLAQESLPDSNFVNLGEGLSGGTATFSIREFACSEIGGKVEAELRTMEKWDARHPDSDYFGIQTDARMKADTLHVERQIIKGLANDAKGFPGAKDMTPFISANTMALTDTPEDSNYAKSVINVGGSTANTASSVYSFVFGEMDSQLVIGNDAGGELFNVSDELIIEKAPDAAAPTKTLRYKSVHVRGLIGLSISGFNQQTEGETVPTQYSVRRAANLTAQEGKGCNDALIELLVTSHGVGKIPSLLAMSARSGNQLAASRAATAIHYSLGGGGDARNDSGSIRPRRPDEWEGIPIVYPQPTVIGNTDAIEA